MNAPRGTEFGCIDFLVAPPRTCSRTEAARVQPDASTAPAHDSFTRLLHRQEPDAETLWSEAKPPVVRRRGVLVIDDSTPAKLYARKIELVTRHWSGKHHEVISGINLITLPWTDGDRKIPVDYRIYSKADGKTKNDHFREMMLMAKGLASRPNMSCSTAGTPAWRISSRSATTAGTAPPPNPPPGPSRRISSRSATTAGTGSPG